MAKTSCRTPGCAGDPDAPGSGNGDCPRCYQWNRRHPKGPPPPTRPAYAADGAALEDWKISVRVERKLKKRAIAAARALGQSASAWLRDAIASKLDGAAR